MNINEKKQAFQEIALERRSIRRYDETVDISREEMTEILELATSAPSSSNMQPWRFVVVSRPEAREKLLPLAQFNVNPVRTASAVIAIFGDLESARNADDIMERTAEKRGQSTGDMFSTASTSDEDGDAPVRPPMPASFEGKRPGEMVRGLYDGMSREQKLSIALIDCGLVTMQLMQAARVFGYDTCALGAYDKDGVSKLLGMDGDRYVPVMLLTIGKAVDSGMPPYRLPVSSVARFSE